MLTSMYMEGKWAAKGILKNIGKTTYGTLDNVIQVKTKLIEHFETEFGFSRTMEDPDSNYAYECGILDALIEEQSKIKDHDREGDEA